MALWGIVCIHFLLSVVYHFCFVLFVFLLFWIFVSLFCLFLFFVCLLFFLIYCFTIMYLLVLVLVSMVYNFDGRGHLSPLFCILMSIKLVLVTYIFWIHLLLLLGVSA